MRLKSMKRGSSGPRFPADRDRLNQIADLLLSRKAHTRAHAMRMLGIDGDANIRRHHYWFQRMASELMAAARARVGGSVRTISTSLPTSDHVTRSFDSAFRRQSETLQSKLELFDAPTHRAIAKQVEYISRQFDRPEYRAITEQFKAISRQFDLPQCRAIAEAMKRQFDSPVYRAIARQAEDIRRQFDTPAYKRLSEVAKLLNRQTNVARELMRELENRIV